MIHHPDCDGFIMHSARMVPERMSNGHTLYTVACEVTGCAWHGPEVGSYGNEKDARREGAKHAFSEPCDGRCMAWE